MSAEQVASGGAGVNTPPTSRLAAFGKQVSLPALTSQLIWALNVSTLKYTISQLDPYVVGCLRALVAGLILFVILWRSEGTVGLRAEHWPRLIFISFFGMGLNTALWNIGLSMSSATNAALLSTISPLIAILLAVGIGQETLAWRRTLGMLVALLGVGLIVQTDGLNLHNENVIGDLIIVACAFTWASYNVFGVPLLRSYSPSGSPPGRCYWGAFRWSPSARSSLPPGMSGTRTHSPGAAWSTRFSSGRFSARLSGLGRSRPWGQARR